MGAATFYHALGDPAGAAYTDVMTNIVQRVAAKAIIIDPQQRILLLRKSHDDRRHAGNSGRYNLPGGKVNPGETIQEAVVREVREEVGLSIQHFEPRPIFVGEWRPVLRGAQMQIMGIFFACDGWDGDIVLTDGEHDTYTWVGEDAVDSYDILPPEGDAMKAYFARARLL
jgi:mutator protein MutT